MKKARKTEKTKKSGGLEIKCPLCHNTGIIILFGGKKKTCACQLPRLK